MSGDQAGAFIWYELMTGDAAGAKAFYDDVIGWTIDGASSAAEGGMDYRMIVRADGGMAGGVLALDEAMLAGGARPGWLGYVQVGDVDTAVESVVAAGGALHMPAMDMTGVGRMAMVADPWGATFYLMTPTPPEDDSKASSDVFSVTEAQHVRWNELRVTDPDAATAFYGALLGWAQEGAMPMGDLGEYKFVQHGSTTIGAICPVMPAGSTSQWRYYIGVEDIDRAVAAIRNGGGTLLGEPQEIPGGEFSLDARDPQGAEFGIVGPRKAG